MENKKAMMENKKTTLEQAVNNQEFMFTEKTELAQVMDTMDSDTALDRNTRVSKDERNALLVMEELKSMGILSDKIGLANKFKSLSISLEGKGREEKVRMIQGDREHKQEGGFLKRLFTPRQPNQ